jgi:hypothetical protein
MLLRRARWALPLAIIAMLATTNAGAAAPRTFAVCSVRGEDTLRYKPRVCSFAVSAPGQSASKVKIKSLRWRSWGSQSAQASGRRVGKGLRQRVGVRLTGMKRCNGKMSYRSVEITQPVR